MGSKKDYTLNRIKIQKLKIGDLWKFKRKKGEQCITEQYITFTVYKILCIIALHHRISLKRK